MNRTALLLSFTLSCGAGEAAFLPTDSEHPAAGLHSGAGSSFRSPKKSSNRPPPPSASSAQVSPSAAPSSSRLRFSSDSPGCLVGDCPLSCFHTRRHVESRGSPRTLCVPVCIFLSSPGSSGQAENSVPLNTSLPSKRGSQSFVSAKTKPLKPLTPFTSALTRAPGLPQRS